MVARPHTAMNCWKSHGTTDVSYGNIWVVGVMNDYYWILECFRSELWKINIFTTIQLSKAPFTRHCTHFCPDKNLFIVMANVCRPSWHPVYSVFFRQNFGSDWTSLGTFFASTGAIFFANIHFGGQFVRTSCLRNMVNRRLKWIRVKSCPVLRLHAVSDKHLSGTIWN